MDKIELIENIKKLKSSYGKKLSIPAHHYQNKDITSLSDFIGDSYKLSVESTKTDASFIVFCGVKFMAESAKVLAKDNQKVLIPTLYAGCPMADMIDEKTAQKVFKNIENVSKHKIAPVVYMNSYADLKSFCGEKDGSVCTSSNAKTILQYYFDKNMSVFFFPDYHLGKNTANLLNIGNEFITKVKKDGTLECTGDPADSKIYLWDGFCHVHQTFTTGDIENLREKYKNIKVIVHPECKEEVVKLSDSSGSTEQIYSTVKNSKPGSIWAIGTELNFIKRMIDEFSDKTIIPLRESPCFNMEKITLENLYESLLSIEKYKLNGSELKYEIQISAEFKINAAKSLNKMIEIVESAK